MFCSNCGMEVNVGDEICPGCGHSIVGGADSKVASPKKKSRKRLIIVALVAGILAVALAAFVVLPLFQQDDAVGYATPEDAVNAYLQGDGYEKVKCLPDFMVRYWAEEHGLSKNASRRQVARAVYGKDSESSIHYTIDRTGKGTPEGIGIDLEMYDLTEEERSSIQDAALVFVLQDNDGIKLEIAYRCIRMNDKWYVL